MLDAQYFGVAQRRRRVFVVGYLGDWRRAAAVLFERHILSGHPAPRRETGKGIANAITERPDRGGGNSEGQRLIPAIAGCLNSAGGHAVPGNSIQDADQGYLIPACPPLSFCLNAGGMGRQDYESETLIPIGGCFDVAHSLRGEGFDASEDGTGRCTPLVPITMPTLRAGAANGGKGHGARSGDSKDEYIVPIAFGWQNSSQQGASASEHFSPTLDKSKTPAVSQGMAVRRLTPVECERLQGFPDGYTDIRLNGKPTPDGPRYKALGNSMAVPCMAWIGRRIQAAIAPPPTSV